MVADLVDVVRIYTIRNRKSTFTSHGHKMGDMYGPTSFDYRIGSIDPLEIAEMTDPFRFSLYHQTSASSSRLKLDFV